MSPHLILEHLISSAVSLTYLVSPSVALPAQLVIIIGQQMETKSQEVSSTSENWLRMKILILMGKLEDTNKTEVESVQLGKALSLVWTIVARANIAWINIKETVGICSRCSQEPTFKVWSRSGQ